MKISWEEAERRMPGCSAAFDRDIATKYNVDVELRFYDDSELRARDLNCPRDTCYCSKYNRDQSRWDLV